jgi:hypothetical protein
MVSWTGSAPAATAGRSRSRLRRRSAFGSRSEPATVIRLPRKMSGFLPASSSSCTCVLRDRLHVVAERDGAHAELCGVQRGRPISGVSTTPRRSLVGPEDQLEAVMAGRDFELVLVAQRVPEESCRTAGGWRNGIAPCRRSAPPQRRPGCMPVRARPCWRAVCRWLRYENGSKRFMRHVDVGIENGRREFRAPGPRAPRRPLRRRTAPTPRPRCCRRAAKRPGSPAPLSSGLGRGQGNRLRQVAVQVAAAHLDIWPVDGDLERVAASLRRFLPARSRACRIRPARGRAASNTATTSLPRLELVAAGGVGQAERPAGRILGAGRRFRPDRPRRSPCGTPVAIPNRIGDGCRRSARASDACRADRGRAWRLLGGGVGYRLRNAGRRKEPPPCWPRSHGPGPSPVAYGSDIAQGRHSGLAGYKTTNRSARPVSAEACAGLYRGSIQDRRRPGRSGGRCRARLQASAAAARRRQ